MKTNLVYFSFGISASHLLTASVMSAPAALAFAKLFYPGNLEGYYGFYRHIKASFSHAFINIMLFV